MTPEGRVKKKISEVLARFPFVYSFMPVQQGRGAAGVDYHCVAGKLFQMGLTAERLPIAFFIEAKKPDGEPTPRQEMFLKGRREQQGCKTFVIDEDPSIGKGGGLNKLIEWLEGIEKNNEHLRATLFTR